MMPTPTNSALKHHSNDITAPPLPPNQTSSHQQHPQHDPASTPPSLRQSQDQYPCSSEKTSAPISATAPPAFLFSLPTPNFSTKKTRTSPHFRNPTTVARMLDPCPVVACWSAAKRRCRISIECARSRELWCTII